MTSGYGFVFLPQSPCCLPLHTQAITGLSHTKSPWDTSPLSSPSPVEQGLFTLSRIHAGCCHWCQPDTFLPCPTLWFLFPPSSQLPSCVPQTAVYSEDLTGASAVHSFHINPLCREEFCPNQVMNSNELCHSSAIQQMTSLPSVLAAALPWWQIPQMRDMNHTKSRSGHGVWVQKDDFSSVLSRHAWPHSAWAHSEGPPPGLVTINEHMQSSELIASFSTASSTGYVKY